MASGNVGSEATRVQSEEEMTKPDDIPQDVWGKASDYADELHVVTDYMFLESRKVIARAIMAAKAEAYTDAADLAQRMGAGRKAQSEQAKIAKHGLVARDFESMAMSAFDVSSAIRKRGETD
jgi:hypothetical protein